MEINHDLFSESNYTIILIRTLLNEDQDIVVIGLSLLELDGDDTRYERVGFTLFYPMHLNRFELWIEGWTQRTITLI